MHLIVRRSENGDISTMEKARTGTYRRWPTQERGQTVHRAVNGDNRDRSTTENGDKSMAENGDTSTAENEDRSTAENGGRLTTANRENGDRSRPAHTVITGILYGWSSSNASIGVTIVR
jgi:hypothetical protein